MLRNLTIAVLSTLILTGQSDAHALSCLSLTGPSHLKKDGIKISAKLADKVKRLESSLSDKTQHVAFFVGDARASSQALLDFKNSMGWRERTLWSSLAKLLGGDESQINEYHSRKKEQQEAEALLEMSSQEAQNAGEVILDGINIHLMRADSKFRQLRGAQKEMNLAMCRGEACLTNISEALERVEQAEFLNRKSSEQELKVEDSVAFNAWHENRDLTALQISSGTIDSAQLGIRMLKENMSEVAEDVMVFNQALAKLKAALDTAKSTEAVDPHETLDLLFELYFDLNFDPTLDPVFAELFSSFDFSSARKDLERLYAEVASLTDQMGEQHQNLKEQLDNQVCAVREMCR